MFLDKTMKRNKELVNTAFDLHNKGLIEPDTYVIDLDRLIENAKIIKDEADKYGIKLYFMAKQLGRNPIICKELIKLGYEGAVVVDFKEAEVMIKNKIKIGHIGHLVQIPSKLIEKILKSRPEYVTVYSIEKAKEIDKVCKKLGIKQKIMIRVLDENDSLYSGQYGGFFIDELQEKIPQLLKLDNLIIDGITSFPCFLYNEENNKIEPTNNIKTIKKTKELLAKKFNLAINQLNMPSSTCVENMKLISENGGTHGEPGHGLTGTTPYHSKNDGVEIQAIVYVSEISHNLKENSYCYGGGHYRRSHLKNALVGKNINEAKIVKVIPATDESIDYHFEIKENCNVGDTVIMAFRTQIFVTRSNVAIVEGISIGNPQILGIYNSLGMNLIGDEI